jgi:hypothetical protein
MAYLVAWNKSEYVDFTIAKVCSQAGRPASSAAELPYGALGSLSPSCKRQQEREFASTQLFVCIPLPLVLCNLRHKIHGSQRPNKETQYSAALHKAVMEI